MSTKSVLPDRCHRTCTGFPLGGASTVVQRRGVVRPRQLSVLDADAEQRLRLLLGVLFEQLVAEEQEVFIRNSVVNRPQAFAFSVPGDTKTSLLKKRRVLTNRTRPANYPKLSAISCQLDNQRDTRTPFAATCGARSDAPPIARYQEVAQNDMRRPRRTYRRRTLGPHSASC